MNLNGFFWLNEDTTWVFRSKQNLDNCLLGFCKLFCDVRLWFTWGSTINCPYRCCKLLIVMFHTRNLNMWDDFWYLSDWRTIKFKHASQCNLIKLHSKYISCRLRLNIIEKWMSIKVNEIKRFFIFWIYRLWLVLRRSKTS